MSGLSIYIFLVTYETQAFNLAQETSSLTKRFQMKQCYALWIDYDLHKLVAHWDNQTAYY